jgi:hypothetical protein
MSVVGRAYLVTAGPKGGRLKICNQKPGASGAVSAKLGTHYCLMHIQVDQFEQGRQALTKEHLFRRWIRSLSGSRAGFVARVTACKALEWIAHSLLLCLVHHELVVELTRLNTRKEKEEPAWRSEGEACMTR